MATLTFKHIMSKRLLTMVAALWMMASMDAQTSKSPAVQLRTNTLYDLAATPNIGLEIQTDLGIAWQLDYMGAWWNNNGKHRYFSNYAFQTEVRYYLDRSHGFPYTGHHAGLYGQMATYDFEFGGKGYMCRDLDKTFGIGLSYGYALRLSKWWSADFTIGIGYFQSKYDCYKPNCYENGYYRTGTKTLRFFGPTKVEVALVWNINYSNRFIFK